MTLQAPVKSPVSIATRPARPRTWDVICIGSGMGSLAAAATLAKFGRSVLIVEAHSQLGGLTHSFTRKKVRWGTGLHYTGWPTSHPSDFPRLWDILTQGRAGWARLPDDTDRYIHPDGVFVKNAPRARYRDDLHATFPGERVAIDSYLDDMRRITADYERFMTLQAVPRAVEKLGLGWCIGRRFLKMDRLPLVTYMNRIGASERLREHLWFTWGNFGGLPLETSVGSYAVPTEYMADGLWTLARGARSAAEAFQATITAAGGELRRNAPVTSLIEEGGRVAGVRIGEEELRARTVISGIGARETYRLLNPAGLRPPHTSRIEAMKPSCSIFTLYLALKRDALEALGLNGVNYWVEFVRGGLRDTWRDLDAPPNWLLLSLASRFQQEESTRDDLVPAEVFVGVSGDQFARWQGTRVMKRGAEYADLKGQLIERTLRRVEEAWPGFRQAIHFAEGASPLTIESYTRHLSGAAYGLAPVPGRYNERALRVATGVPGLMLTGQDISASGVIGAFYGGMASASALLRRNARTALPRAFA
jgi:all-trans-retinol 13,14-reductase